MYYFTFKPYRPAIAMIELIFAIVVMGIVMLSAPMLLTTAGQSGYITIQQEGINEAAAQANIILGYAWDENNTVDEHKPVLSANGDAGLNATLTLPKRRAGTPALSYRIFISYDGSEFDASTIGLDTGEGIGSEDDIDDFNNTSVTLTLEAGGVTTKDYVEKGNKVSIARTVEYISDAENGAGTYLDGGGGVLTFVPNFTPVSNTTNIKHIMVTLTSNSNVNELQKQITLHAFSCNIGHYELEEKL